MQLAPEYFPVKKLLMALPYHGSDWQPVLGEVLTCYGAIVTTLLEHDSTINIIVLAKNQQEAGVWLASLCLSSDLKQRLTIKTDVAYNDTWTRDYGPLTLTGDAGLRYCSFSFNGWGNKYPADLDNRAALQLQNELGAQIDKYAFVLEGGAIEINSAGVLLVNRDCIIDEQRNPGLGVADWQALFKQHLGVREIEWVQNIGLTGDDTDGHIDTIARFVRDDTIVVCGESESHPDAIALKSLNHQLRQLCERRNWQLIHLPMPSVKSVVDGRHLPATYANFLICNGKLFVPVYGVAEDELAIKTLLKALPEYLIIPINCAALIEQHGSLHCATMQIG